MTDIRVGIIGGGWSGIFCAKHCLEANLIPTVFESRSQVGGQWIYSAEEPGGVRKNTTTVSSKIYMSPSDYPYPDEDPEFLPADKVHKHLIEYAKHFKVEPHLRLNHKVQSVTKTDNDWVVSTNYGEQHFDKIIVAGGTNSVPKIPQEKKYSKFSGEKVHSHSLPDGQNLQKRYKGKSVLIIGGSDTASDIACLLSNDANVTVSVRNGTWFQDKFAIATNKALINQPSDMIYNRFLDFWLRISNYTILTTFGFIQSIETSWGVCGSDISKWFSKAGYLNTYYTKSRDLVHKVRRGEIDPQKGVESIDENKVKFYDDPKTYAFDTIIFCTGYKSELQFKINDAPTNTHYRKILNIKDPSLAFVGYIRPYVTSITMLAEMQARWVADVFSGRLKLPTADKMLKLQENNEAIREKRFPLYAKNMQFLVDPFLYMNRLAIDIKAKPSFIWMFFKAPKMLYRVVFDSWNHFVFRLNDANPIKREIAKREIEALENYPATKLILRPLIRNGFLNLYDKCWNASKFFKDRSSKPQRGALPERTEGKEITPALTSIRDRWKADAENFEIDALKSPTKLRL